MSATIGPASTIIAQALELGLLCRPTKGTGVGYGEALEVSDTCFWLVIGGKPWDRSEPYTIRPTDLLCDWALTTKDLIQREWQSSVEEPF